MVGRMSEASIIRSYHGEYTGSHPNSEVKHPWAHSVLRWGTTRESLVVNVLPPRYLSPGSRIPCAWVLNLTKNEILQFFIS